MADLILVCWRDIPAQIIVKKGRASAKRELPNRFIEAIDRCAMLAKATAAGDYLDDWRRAAPLPCGDDLEAEADAALARIEAEYDGERLGRLVAALGRDSPSGSAGE